MGTLKEDYIYLAGLIDGEGCITKGCSANFTVALKIGMVEKSIIDWLEKTFGGHVSIHNDKRESRKEAHQWNMHKAEDLIFLLEKIIPYLKIKKNRAKLAVRLSKRILKAKNLWKVEKLSESKKRMRKKFYEGRNNKLSKNELMNRKNIMNKIMKENQRYYYVSWQVN